jgi:hypothetical protein
VAASTDELDLAPYAGRWIAIVRGRVAGVGLSPEEARCLAKRNRPREEPVIVFVSGEGKVEGAMRNSLNDSLLVDSSA